MMIRYFFTLALFTFIPIAARSQQNSQSLFNGKDLNGWDTYVASRYDTMLKKRVGKPLGLNNDSLKIFSVADVDGKPALRISGERFGGISTQREFQNYHLSLEFKWGTKRWAPRHDKKRDSGVLYHAVGPHGVDAGSWMRSQEYQVQEGDCGDYWGIDGAGFDIPAVQKDEKTFIYDPQGKLLSFSKTSPAGRRCIKNPDNEKPTGEWNRIEIYCLGDTAVHLINGKVNMVLFNSRQPIDGKDAPLSKGKIQIQSEGAEVYYRNISVRPISKLPKSLLKR